MLEGYNKKQKRMILLQEKLKQRNRVVVVSKKQVLCSPDPKWPRIDPSFLTMKQVSSDPKTGCKIFSFVKSPEYQSLQKEFARVQATCDIQALADFLRANFYHHESLIFIADYLRLQGKFSDAAGFLERCLFAFEQAFSFDFQFVPASTSQEDKLNFRLQSRIDWEREPLNKVFAECLIKHIDLMGRKGCNRTGLEFCKLLLSIDPLQDPYGVLLRIDYYAIRAKEYKYLRKLIKQLPFEVHSE